MTTDTISELVTSGAPLVAAGFIGYLVVDLVATIATKVRRARKSSGAFEITIHSQKKLDDALADHQQAALEQQTAVAKATAELTDALSKLHTKIELLTEIVIEQRGRLEQLEEENRALRGEGDANV